MNLQVKQDTRAAKKAAYEARRQAVDAGRQAAGRATGAGDTPQSLAHCHLSLHSLKMSTQLCFQLLSMQ